MGIGEAGAVCKEEIFTAFDLFWAIVLKVHV